MIVRSASTADLPNVSSLLETYMGESFNRRWEGSTAALERDGLGREFHTLIATSANEPVGFVCWHRIYNVHYCVAGGEICDMFMRKERRHGGAALKLLASAAKDIQAKGGHFVRGRADPHLERLYSRRAIVVPGAECYLGGKAFESLAANAEAGPRQILLSLTRS